MEKYSQNNDQDLTQKVDRVPFTAGNTLNELLTQAGKEMGLFFSSGMLSFIPEEYRDLPLSGWAEDFLMPWGMPFQVQPLVDDANLTLRAEQEWDWVPLWTSGELSLSTNDMNSVGMMIPKCELEGTCPAVIICPGGAYENLAFDSEGFYTAKRLQKAGYRAFVLRYRYSPNRYPIPQLDLALAIKHVRANAGRYQIDPENLMILGYSAGGHLCASAAALREEIDRKLTEALEVLRPELVSAYRDISVRPDKLCLCYPVISFLSEAHEPSFQNLAGGDESLREQLSVEKQVDANFPKTFVWACEDDGLVPASNTVRMGQALEEKNITSMTRLYPQGNHGCSLGTGTSAEGWVDEMLEFMK